ncbi:MAG: hypothetical protein R3F30_10875 [Planctomycetota bacterium]
MNKKLHEILHRYKVETFKLTHDHEEIEKITKECLSFSEEVLDNAYHYHFHKLPDANRAEIINMINNYTVEALLPPVVEKLLRRIVVLEKQHQQLLSTLTEVLEALSEEQGTR